MHDKVVASGKASEAGDIGHVGILRLDGDVGVGLMGKNADQRVKSVKARTKLVICRWDDIARVCKRASTGVGGEG